MAITIKNLLIPTFFSINKSPRQWHIELNFSREPEKTEKYIPDSRDAWQKADQLYRKNNIYGDHQYLVPVWQEMSGYFASFPQDKPIEFKQIGNDPTVAVAYQKLQLMPCSQHNLGLIQSKLQSEPFFIEIGKKSFSLYVWHQGMYWKIPSQRHPPLNWSRNPHPVITLETVDGAIVFNSFRDIPWSDIAQQIGVPIVPKKLDETRSYFNY